MAHSVGARLKIRPNEILDTWGTAELLVAFGQYANEVSRENYESWKNQDPKYRKGHPEKVAVKFLGVDFLNEEGGV